MDLSCVVSNIVIVLLVIIFYMFLSRLSVLLVYLIKSDNNRHYSITCSSSARLKFLTITVLIGKCDLICNKGPLLAKHL